MGGYSADEPSPEGLVEWLKTLPLPRESRILPADNHNAKP